MKIPRAHITFGFLWAFLVLLFPGCWDATQADQRIDIGGYELGVYCVGEGSPTVIMEAGLGSTSGSWRRVQPDVRTYTHVCSYDRAGLGRSDPRPNTDTDGGTVVEELHKLTEALHLQPPYVLVGHSVGGMYISLYQHRYPGEVAGLVFVEPSHEDQFARFDALGQIPNFGNEGGSHIDFGPVVEELHGNSNFGDDPVVSITRGMSSNDTWDDLRRAIAQRSTNSLLVKANHTGHQVQRDSPGIVIDAIEAVVDSVRTGQTLLPCEEVFKGRDATCMAVR